MNLFYYLRSLLLLSALCGLMVQTASTQPPASPPNIIHVFADDLGYGDIEPFGQEIIRTPNLQTMAAQGMKFTQHYSSAPVCLPARSCLMTGLHQGHVPQRYNQDKRNSLPAEYKIIPEYLKEAGYATGAFGKWSIGEEGPGVPWEQGFDTFFGYLNQSAAHDFYPAELDHNDQRVELPGNKGDGQETYSHDVIFNRALDFIRDHRSGPFYVYLPITPPHADYVVPDDEILAYYREKMPGLSQDFDEDDMAYAAMIERIDRDMGRLFSLLQELGVEKNTVVLIDSDNGPSLPGMANRFNSTAGLRASKRSLYEGGIRVPLIVHWPAGVEAGTVCDQPTVGYDFLATFTELAGVEVTEPTDGRSIVPLLRGEELPERGIYWEFVSNKNAKKPEAYQQAARRGSWKAYRTRSSDPDRFHTPTELYNLEQDPGEKNDVSTEHPDIVKQLNAFMDANASEDHLPE